MFPLYCTVNYNKDVVDCFITMQNENLKFILRLYLNNYITEPLLPISPKSL